MWTRLQHFLPPVPVRTEASPRPVPPNTMSSLTGLWWLRNFLAIQESTRPVLPPPELSWTDPVFTTVFLPRMFFLTGLWPLSMGWGCRLAVGGHGGWGFSVGTIKKVIYVWASASGSSAEPSDSSSQQRTELLMGMDGVSFADLIWKFFEKWVCKMLFCGSNTYTKCNATLHKPHKITFPTKWVLSCSHSGIRCQTVLMVFTLWRFQNEAEEEMKQHSGLPLAFNPERFTFLHASW